MRLLTGLIGAGALTISLAIGLLLVLCVMCALWSLIAELLANL